MKSRYSIHLLKYLLAVFMAATIHSASSFAQVTFTESSPKREVRAIWLTTLNGMDWPHTYAQSVSSVEEQKKELCHLLDLYQQAGINTV